MTTLNIYLFGKPEWELDSDIKPQHIREKGDELKRRLQEVARTVEKLEAHGWECHLALYDLILYKNIRVVEAQEELDRLNISNEVCIIDDEEYDE